MIRRRSQILASTLALAQSGLSACCSAPEIPKTESREVCVVQTEAKPALPRLYRRANAGTRNLGPASLLCDVPHANRSMGDRCEAVDDLSALLGTGKVCGPNGVAPQSACPSYPAERIDQEKPAVTTPVCPGGCENVQIAVRETSGTVTRIVFYDDPVCHTAADPACPGAEHTCYYRVLALESAIR